MKKKNRPNKKNRLSKLTDEELFDRKAKYKLILIIFFALTIVENIVATIKRVNLVYDYDWRWKWEIGWFAIVIFLTFKYTGIKNEIEARKKLKDSDPPSPL